MCVQYSNARVTFKQYIELNYLCAPSEVAELNVLRKGKVCHDEMLPFHTTLRQTKHVQNILISRLVNQ